MELKLKSQMTLKLALFLLSLQLLLLSVETRKVQDHRVVFPADMQATNNSKDNSTQKLYTNGTKIAGNVSDHSHSEASKSGTDTIKFETRMLFETDPICAEGQVLIGKHCRKKV